MPLSSPSCAVAFPRDRNNATDNDRATKDATTKAETTSKAASIKELREQLRAQQGRNQGATEKGGLSGELREVLAWLHRIDETDNEIIECTISRCRNDSDALAYFVGRARE